MQIDTELIILGVSFLVITIYLNIKQSSFSNSVNILYHLKQVPTINDAQNQGNFAIS